MVSNATQTRLIATSDYSQSYVVFNNTVPGFAGRSVSFFVDGTRYANSTANATGFVSFNYMGAWLSHTFEWVVTDSETRSASGYVKDPNGIGIQSAEVAENVTGHVTYTDSSGRYSLSGLINGSYNISATRAGYSQNFRIVTISGANVANANITLIPETTPPASITALLNNTYAQTYINWVWADPLDVDFSKVMIYLNGIFQTNVTKGTQSYNAASLIPDTSYTISTHTVDSTGNVNMTWVNHSASTSPLPQTQILSTFYDNRLRESTPNDILGTLPYSDIGHLLGTGRFRDVMWVDLSSYNSSDKITSAILSLFWYYPAGNARNYPTTVELYRPLSWDPNSVNWNNGSNGMPWTNSGGDWYDRNGAFNGSVPFTSLTFSATTLPDNRYYDFNVTGLVQDYVSGKYPNTGFFLKAKDEYDNYIAFYSSNHSNPDQTPKLTITYTTGGACSPYDMNCDSLVDETDRNIVWNSINTGIYCECCDVNNNTEVEVFDWVMVSGNSVL